MWIALLLSAVALTINVWLWGHWSFEKSAGLTLILVLNAFLLFYLFLGPIFRFAKTKNLKTSLSFWPVKLSFYLTMVLTIVLSIASFYGLIQYLLPIKIILLAIFAFLKLKK